jgi:hypothetical protein
MNGCIVKVRIVADDEHNADIARAYLLKHLPGLSLGRANIGRNPKYAGNPKWLAYGDLALGPRGGATVRRRRTKARKEAIAKTPAPRPVRSPRLTGSDLIRQIVESSGGVLDENTGPPRRRLP